MLDLGANTGQYSRIAARLGCRTISCDGDPAAVEKNYRATVATSEERILPLVIDLANPPRRTLQLRPRWRYGAEAAG